MGLFDYFTTRGVKEIANAGTSGSQSPSAEQMKNSMIQPPHATEPGSHDGTPRSGTSGPWDKRVSRASMTPSLRSHSFMDDIKHEVMVNYLHQQQCARMWMVDGSRANQGVLVRKTRGIYMACPPQLRESDLASAAAALNLQAVMTVDSRVVRTLLESATGMLELPLSNGLHVQVLPSLEQLPRARKHQMAAVIASEPYLVVWDDEATHLVERAAAIEADLMNLIWKNGSIRDQDHAGEKSEIGPDITILEVDEESGELIPQARPVHIMNAALVGFTIFLVVAMLGAGFREVAGETAVDKNYMRIAFIALVPVQVFFTLFFAQVVVGCIAQCIGPIRQMKTNSRYYSAQAPARLRNGSLPHVTIQCPVYKEGLASVIAPTIKSIKQAISTYELQGGSANMFVNDDGLQLLDEEERNQRIDFYADHSIGWVARPKHGENGFLRRGKFKKASNMNFALMISCKVEDKLRQIDRSQHWDQNDEAEAYEHSLKQVLAEDGRAWADGNIRVGDYILLIDSDTRVPADCLFDAASEMEQSPEVGIMQFSSGVMQVVHTYFENGITFFTNLIYTAIRYTVSNGDVAPFVGHNAILRWSALQMISYFDEDGYEKFWSESHVSEDFDMALRLQVNGYIIRLAAWAGDGFKEGVSLTVYDELARWEKYAYGCNELLFHPVRFWLTRGPFTPLFRKFLFSNIRVTSKITILSYIGTYYAIGAAWIMTTANYFAIGWFNGYLDKYYIDSWKVWFSIVIVFNGLGNVALAIMRYRTGDKPFLSALLENIKWIPLLAIFLGGLSLHISSALLAHMFSVNMTWGATAKEAEFSNFFIEVPKVLRRFKFSMGFAVIMMAAMVVLAKASWVPWDWHIKDMVAILPMATVAGSHLLLPVALNPALMTFSW
ncbi:putative glycosyltransferase family 2 protein [Viridothelium virens]|uniref:Putative glycosyltransferase family 2 protein n=1 Tax=Viridothelium virens TaxID=1048519 RepID=A0A6A6HIN8_VIRVR|nr:putative glycosyltransferase family 2 protein [Viridothelium virens]